MKNFGLRLKKLRESRGLSIEDFAKEVGMSKFILKYWEKGERTLRISQLIKVSQYFGVSIDYLVGL